MYMSSKFQPVELSLDEDSYSTAIVERTLPLNPGTKLCLSEKRDLKSKEKSAGKFINCDLSIFNLELCLKPNFSYDVIMIDPPWRIKGQEKQDSSKMFSNSSFKHTYRTMSNQDILNLQVESLSEKGLCFLWVLNCLIDVGYKCLQKWGYDVIDQIVWVKSKKNKLHIGQGFYFLHSSEICLVGLKKKKGEIFNFNTKVSS